MWPTGGRARAVRAIRTRRRASSSTAVARRHDRRSPARSDRPARSTSRRACAAVRAGAGAADRSGTGSGRRGADDAVGAAGADHDEVTVAGYRAEVVARPIAGVHRTHVEHIGRQVQRTLVPVPQRVPSRFDTRGSRGARRTPRRRGGSTHTGSDGSTDGSQRVISAAWSAPVPASCGWMLTPITSRPSARAASTSAGVPPKRCMPDASLTTTRPSHPASAARCASLPTVSTARRSTPAERGSA